MMRLGWWFGLGLVACGGDKSGDTGADSDTGGVVADATQTPPIGYAAIEAWIADGHYLGWACDSARQHG